MVSTKLCSTIARDYLLLTLGSNVPEFSLLIYSKRMGGNLFLGLDCSTQTLKATFVDENFKEIEEFQCVVNYDTDLPHFNTRGGVHHGKDGITVTTPTLLWVSALDLLMDKMKSQKVPFEKIAAISGSGQQHGR